MRRGTGAICSHDPGGSALLISPGVTTTLTLVTTAPDVDQVEVQIDQQRFRVTLP